MAIDTLQKRMAAMNPACPWRGAMVNADEIGFNVGNRRAALFLYSASVTISVFFGSVYTTLRYRGRNTARPRYSGGAKQVPFKK